MKLKTFEELGLGDIVRLIGISKFQDCIVYKKIFVEAENKYQSTAFIPKSFHVWRPYCICSDFATTAGVIPYIGLEDFEIFPKVGEKFEVVEDGPKELK